MLEEKVAAAIDYVWGVLEVSAVSATSKHSPPAWTKRESVLEGIMQPGPRGGTRWDLIALFYY